MLLRILLLLLLLLLFGRSPILPTNGFSVVFLTSGNGQSVPNKDVREVEEVEVEEDASVAELEARGEKPTELTEDVEEEIEAE